jgi:IS1 family transposase
MYISQEKAVLALQLLLEGNSIRSTERITNLDRNTIMSLLVRAGERCQTMMVRTIVGLNVRDVEADEIWGFVGKKEGHKTLEDGAQVGDAYCFIAIERNTKLVLAHHVGKRSKRSTETFIEKLRYATAEDSKFQFTTDGFRFYREAHQGVRHSPRRGAAVQPRRSRGGSPSPGLWQPRSQAHLHLAHRAPEPFGAHGDAPHDAPHQRLL